MTSRHTRLAFASDVVLQVVGGEALILKLQDESVFSLNDTGARVAQLIAGGHDVDQVTAMLAEEYAIDLAHVAPEVERLVDMLVARGLLVIRPDGVAS